MTKGPEHLVKSEIKKQLNSLGEDCWWYMPVAGPFSVAGIPDFVGVYCGFGFAIEAKAEKGRATAWQKLHLERINFAGGMGVIVKGVLEAQTVAQRLKDAHKVHVMQCGGTVV